MRQLVKDIGYRLFPRLTLTALSIRTRRSIERDAAKRGLDSLARKIAGRTGNRVAQGPFAGMIIDYDALPVHASPRYLGTYEKEVYPYVEKIIEMQPRSVLNLGSSDGYYSVGMARRLPNATIYSAEADPKSDKAVRRNAELNGVRVQRIGIVKRGQLARYLSAKRSTLIMDCEGAEFTLLDIHTDPVLCGTTMLIECHHDFGSADDLIARFASSHTATQIHQERRTAIDLPDPRFADLPAGMEEWRCGTGWIYFEPR